jgi:acetyl esterase
LLFDYRFTSNALRDENDKKNPRASVLLSESFDKLPPCLFIVAELDPLRDDSYGKKKRKEKENEMQEHSSYILEYQKKLEAAGVKTKLVLINNVIHSFFSLPGKILDNQVK